MSRRTEWMLAVGVVLLALLLRVVGHQHAPNGWRDDELSNALVVSQHVLNGEIRLYYDDASGHEGLYHWLQAGTMALFGPGVWGIRGVSILAGTASVALTYALTRRLYDVPTALIAALLLAVSFWGLMYSRSGQRHVLVTVTTLTSFLLLWQAMPSAENEEPDPRLFALAGAAMGLGFYTYFASRGVPLIVLAWGGYLAVWQRDLFRRVWRGLALMLGTAFLLALPLMVTLAQQPEAEARVAELAKPIYDARDGDFSTVAAYTRITLSMFTHDGDSEVLYIVPGRPVFGVFGGILFWAGVLVALRTFEPRAMFLLLWLGAGLAPGVLSVPAASLGHNILEQTPAMIMPALALRSGAEWLSTHRPQINGSGFLLGAALLLGGWEAGRGIYDYWIRWPADGFNRVLHHSDLHEAAQIIDGPQDVVIAGFLNERWDQQAMRLSLPGEGWRIRAFDPRLAELILTKPHVVVVPGYLAADGSPRIRYVPGSEFPAAEGIPFSNGLHLLTASVRGASATTLWCTPEGIDLPPYPLLSKPPAPDEDATPRLRIFHHIVDETGAFITATDALGVDPYTLFPGDCFRQTVTLDRPPQPTEAVIIGLYDPATGMRIETVGGLTGVAVED
ncbi:MAG: glycosyltransferase family 39 protein [Anaerolineae bacterium]